MWSPAMPLGTQREAGAKTTRKPETREQIDQKSVGSEEGYSSGNEEQSSGMDDRRYASRG